MIERIQWLASDPIWLIMAIGLVAFLGWFPLAMGIKYLIQKIKEKK
jgi:hypothetical protein